MEGGEGCPCPVKKMMQEEKNISVKAAWTGKKKKKYKFYTKMLPSPSVARSS